MEDKLGNKLADQNTIRNPLLIQAFNKIDRREFVPVLFGDQAHIDAPLPIGYDQTISQPSTVGFMLELLDLQEGHVGSGSGWTTALLADIVGANGFVIGVEIITSLVEKARSNLDKYPQLSAEIRLAGDEIGLEDDVPCDRILVSAAADNIEQELVDQLKVGGKLVMPVGGSIFLIEKTDEQGYQTDEYPGFVFVPLIK